MWGVVRICVMDLTGRVEHDRQRICIEDDLGILQSGLPDIHEGVIRARASIWIRVSSCPVPP